MYDKFFPKESNVGAKVQQTFEITKENCEKITKWKKNPENLVNDYFFRTIFFAFQT
jgi:hypothetical protein